MQESYKKLVGLAIIIAVVYLGFRYLLPLFFPFVLAYMTAALLRRPVQFLQNKLHIRPVLGGTVLLLLFLTAAGGGIAFGIKLLLRQFAELAANYDIYTAEWSAYLETVCEYVDGFLKLHRGSSFTVLSSSLDGIILFFQEELIPFLTRNSLKAALSVTELVAAVILTFVASLLFLTELVKPQEAVEVKKEKLKQRACQWNQRENKNTESGSDEEQFFFSAWRQVKKELSGAGTAYIKTQAILIALVSITCSLGLLLLRSPYAMLFGVAIGIFDAFPILGSGLILIPWSAARFFQGNAFDGAVLLTLYGLCQFFREYLEPKLLGGKMGMRPIHSLMAVYVGYELFGMFGLFLGPIGLVLVKSVWRVTGRI